jgi:hypothetical protein
MIDYFVEKIKYVLIPSYRNKVNERKNFINNLKEPGQLEKTLLIPLSEYENRFGITKERNDLGVYPADGC